MEKNMEKKTYDIAVLGGSIGGVMAAFSAASMGKKVYLCEESRWIGGQFTSQGIPPDEHPWIETAGCTQSYRRFRNRVREFYREQFPVTEESKRKEFWDIGGASVSRLAHEPLVSLHLFYEMLLPYLCSGFITLETETKAVDCLREGGRIQAVNVKRIPDDRMIQIEADYFIDATDCGDLLPITGTEYVTGAEGRDETGEPHAPEKAAPHDMQPVTWVAALEYCENEAHMIEKPEMYDVFASMLQPYDRYPVLSWYGPDSTTGKAKKFGMFTDEGEGLFPLWSYRRIVMPSAFEEGFRGGDIVFLNWPQNDCFMGNIYECEEAEKNRYTAKQLTLSLLYWLQTEAPRKDGKKGYPGLKLCPWVLGTEDGLAQAPYIRESRRIRALVTVREQDISRESGRGPAKFSDTVGVGSYPIDLHITTESHTFTFYESRPFEIPMGALIPAEPGNLIAGCKNIGTTHLTNGCFRLHPVEWNVGEAAGFLAAFALETGLTPKQIWSSQEKTEEFQRLLTDHGVEIHWDESIL